MFRTTRSRAWPKGAYAAGVVGLLAALLGMWPQTLGGDVAYVRVAGYSMEPRYHSGDLAVVRRQDGYRVGDVVAFRIPAGDVGAGALVIHRLTGGDGRDGFLAQGDNRAVPDPWRPRAADVVGRVVVRVPYAGTAVGELSRPALSGALLAGLTAFAVAVPAGGRRREQREAPAS